MSTRSGPKGPQRPCHEASLKRLLRSKGTKILLRREHPPATQAVVIFLRYKSLKNDAEPWLTATEVYRRTGV